MRKADKFLRHSSFVSFVFCFFFLVDVLLPIIEHETVVDRVYSPRDGRTHSTDARIETRVGGIRISKEGRGVIETKDVVKLGQTQLFQFSRYIVDVKTGKKIYGISFLYEGLKVLSIILMVMSIIAFRTTSLIKLRNVGSGVVVLFCFGLILAFHIFLS